MPTLFSLFIVLKLTKSRIDPFLFEKISMISLPNTFWLWIVAFICIDFAQYWIHRLKHKVNIFWNIHVIHHSSEEFNLACALRQSISNLIGFTAVFLIPAAIVGIPYKIISILRIYSALCV